MKILFLARRFYPDIGGVEKHILEISKLLILKGHSITIITDTQGSNKKYENINIIRIPRYSDNFLKKFKIWIWFLRNRELFKQMDIIHAHDVYIWYWPLKLLFPSKKSFITFHGYESYPISKKAILIRKISELLANGNIAVGDFIKKWYYTKPDFIIYGAVSSQKNKKIEVNRYSAIFTGRLDYHTSILDYAKAVDIVKIKYPKFKFNILGDGEYKSKLKKYNLIGLKNDATRYIPKNNFAFASRYLAILEAFSAKKLVFALYDNPVREDYLRMSPFSKFIVIEKSPEVLAEKIIYFLETPKKADPMIKKGYEWVSEQKWEKIVNIYLKLWNEKN